MHLLSIKMAFYPQKNYLCQSQFFYSKYSIDILFPLLFALFFYHSCHISGLDYPLSPFCLRSGNTHPYQIQVLT